MPELILLIIALIGVGVYWIQINKTHEIYSKIIELEHQKIRAKQEFRRKKRENEIQLIKNVRKGMLVLLSDRVE